MTTTKEQAPTALVNEQDAYRESEDEDYNDNAQGKRHIILG